MDGWMAGWCFGFMESDTQMHIGNTWDLIQRTYLWEWVGVGFFDIRESEF